MPRYPVVVEFYVESTDEDAATSIAQYELAARQESAVDSALSDFAVRWINERRDGVAEDLFSADDAKEIIRETRAYISRAEACIEAEEYVAAAAWIERATEVIGDQDVFGLLATGEARAVLEATQSPTSAERREEPAETPGIPELKGER